MSLASPTIRYADVIRSFILVGPLYLVRLLVVRIKEPMSLKDTCLYEIGLRVQIFLTIPHSIVNTVGGGAMHLVKESTNIQL